tara:strand:- start:51 stop:599 length:549 start_codon:yes stop_codon:yes gene_type:complete
MGLVNAFVAYKFIKILAQPWEKTDAFRLGIIDKNGKVLRKRNTLKTAEEKKANTIIHTLVWKIKKILTKIRIGKSRLGSLAAALWFLKEELQCDTQLLEESVLSCLDKFGIDPEEFKKQTLKESFESDHIVESGTYKYNNHIIIIKEELTSFDAVFDIPLFFINTGSSKYVFSKDEIKKVSQ